MEFRTSCRRSVKLDAFLVGSGRDHRCADDDQASGGEYCPDMLHTSPPCRTGARISVGAGSLTLSRPRSDAIRVTEEFSTEHRLRGRRRARPREALAKYRNPPPHMDHVHVPMLLPDITFDTRPTDYSPVNQMQLRLRRHVLARLWRHRQRLVGPAVLRLLLSSTRSSGPTSSDGGSGQPARSLRSGEASRPFRLNRADLAVSPVLRAT